MASMRLDYILFASYLSVLFAAAQYNYDHHYSLMPSGKFYVKWLNDSNNLIINMQVATQGWMGMSSRKN
jgi:hypothetical protein